MKQTRLRPVDLGLLCLLLLAIAFYAVTQGRVTFMDGLPYDAGYYHIAAERFAGTGEGSAIKPFAYRLANPWLSAKLYPQNLVQGFYRVNTLLGLLLLIALGCLLMYHARQSGHAGSAMTLTLVTLLLFVANPSAPVRFTPFYPVMTDTGALLCIVLILLISARRKPPTISEITLITGLTVAGVLFREITLAATLVYAATRFISDKAIGGTESFTGSTQKNHATATQSALLGLVPVVAGFSLLGLIHMTAPAIGDYSYGSNVVRVLQHHLQNPTIYPLAWFMGFGPMLCLVLASTDRELLKWLSRNPEIPLYLLGIAALAAIAGYHTDRFAFWAFPAVLAIFIFLLQSDSWRQLGRLRQSAILLPMAAAQILAFRVWLPIPDDTHGQLLNPGASGILLFAPQGDDVNLGQIYAAYMTGEARKILLVQYGLLLLYFIAVRHWPRSKTAAVC